MDVAAALADSFGLKLEVVNVGSDAESALKEGTVDIVMGIDKSDSSTSFWKSDAYLPTAVALFSAPSNTQVPTNVVETKIAAQVSSKSAWAVTNEFDKATFSTTDDLKSAFAELASGPGAVRGGRCHHRDVRGAQRGRRRAYRGAHAAGGGYGVGVSDANTDLKQAVSEALATLTGNGTIGVIETKWLGTALDLSSTPLTAGATKSTDAGATVASKEPKDESEGENADGDAAPADEGTGAGDEVNAGENAVQPGDVAA